MPKIIGTIKIYDLKELSEMLDLTVQSLRTYINSGKIQGKKFGTKWYVSDKALTDYFTKFN
jgi:hypothetical protein